MTSFAGDCPEVAVGFVVVEVGVGGFGAGGTKTDAGSGTAVDLNSGVENAFVVVVLPNTDVGEAVLVLPRAGVDVTSSGSSSSSSESSRPRSLRIPVLLA